MRHGSPLMVRDERRLACDGQGVRNGSEEGESSKNGNGASYPQLSYLCELLMSLETRKALPKVWSELGTRDVYRYRLILSIQGLLPGTWYLHSVLRHSADSNSSALNLYPERHRRTMNSSPIRYRGEAPVESKVKARSCTCGPIRSSARLLFLIHA